MKKDKDQSIFFKNHVTHINTHAHADKNTSPNSYSTVLFHLATAELSLSKSLAVKTSQIQFKQMTGFNRIQFDSCKTTAYGPTIASLTDTQQ